MGGREGGREVASKRLLNVLMDDIIVFTIVQ